MEPKTLSVLMHTAEAVVVLAAAVAFARYVPEYRAESFAIAFAMLSALAKGARVSKSMPVPDYVNEEIGMPGKEVGAEKPARGKMKEPKQE